MARPSNATVLSHTPNGIPFQWLTDGYGAKGARDANLETLQVLVGWADAGDFLEEVVGFTTWDGAAPRLHRSLPLADPFGRGLWCEDYSLVKFGAYESRTDFNDPFNDNAIEQDWAIYQLTFTRPKYWVRSDATLLANYDGIEKNRYASLQRQYVPREKKISSYGFEYEAAPGNWQIVPDETAFRPDYTVRYLLRLHQWPVGAVPEAAWAAQLLTVNHADFQLQKGGFGFPKETLMFKGPQEPIEWYQGADGGFYIDTTLAFDFRPGTYGWNGYEKRELTPAGARQYGRVRRRNVAPDTPAYALTPFDNLFVPSLGA